MGQILFTLYYCYLQFFLPSGIHERGIKTAENWVSLVNSKVNKGRNSDFEFYFNFRFKPGDRTSKSLRMIHNCDLQQPQAQPQVCQADVAAWWPLKTPFWIRWSKRPQLKEAIRVIFNEIDILFLKLQFSFSKKAAKIYLLSFCFISNGL